MAIQKSWWKVLIPLLFILCVYNKSLLDPTQPLKLFLLGFFVCIANFYLLFKSFKTSISFTLSKGVVVYLLYIILSLLSTFYSPNLSGGLSIGILSLFCFNFFILGLTFFNSQKTIPIRQVSIVFCAFQLIVCIDTIFNLVASNFTINSPKIMGGLFVNPNLTSQILFLTLPFSLIYFFNSKSLYGKILATFSSIISLLIIILLGSRTVWLALFVMSATFVFFSFLTNKHSQLLKQKRKGMVIGLFFLALLISPFFITYSFSGNSVEIRKELWNRTFSSIKENPIKGEGLGSWLITNPTQNTADSTINKETQIGHITTYQGGGQFVRPHHDFLWVWSESGIFTFLLYLLFFFFILYYGVTLILSHKAAEQKFYTLLVSVIAGYLIIASFSAPKERVEHSLILAIIVIFIYSAYHKIKQQEKNRFKLSSFFVGLFVLLSATTTYIAYKKVQSEYYFSTALTAKNKSNWKALYSESVKAENEFYKLASNGIPIDWYSGLALINLGEIKKANLYFERAYKVHPNHVHVLNNLATTYMMLGNFEFAKKYYQKALQINPNFEDSRINLSAVYFNEGNINDAYENIAKVYYKTSHPKYIPFTQAIIQSKYQNEFFKIAKEKGDLKKAKNLLLPGKPRFYILYKQALDSNITIQEAFRNRFTDEK